MLFKNKYRIESARLKNWDYSSDGYYFVTICTHDRIRHFGKITNRTIVLSDMGNIADKYWREIPDHFPFAKLIEHVIMPNHIHGIIEIIGGHTGIPCTTDIPDNHDISCTRTDTDTRRDAINRVSTGIGIGIGTDMDMGTGNIRNTGNGTENAGDTMDTSESMPNSINIAPTIPGGITKTHNPMLNPFSLSKIIRWYKGRVAFEINKNNPLHDFTWQPRFYDSIIRTNKDLFRVKKYIVNNPINWDNDDLHS